MKIYVNSNYEIKAINSNEDSSLMEYEIDRKQVFGDMSDFMILNYCYKPDENGYCIYPAKDFYILQLLDNQNNTIFRLSEQNEKHEESIASLTYELMMLQEPISVIILDNNHSPKFNSIKLWYNKGYWNDEMVLNAVIKGYISEDESKEIIDIQI